MLTVSLSELSVLSRRTGHYCTSDVNRGSVPLVQTGMSITINQNEILKSSRSCSVYMDKVKGELCCLALKIF